jgi:hypothetical protein
MPKRQFIIPVLAIICLAIGAMLMSMGQREPTYEGRKLSEWIMIYAENPYPGAFDQASNAVRHIGTNGIPHYLKWIQYQAPAWKRRLYPIVTRISGRSALFLIDKKVIYAGFAPRAFQILGSQAKDAIPELARLLNSPGGLQSESAQIAVTCLPYIGEQALPSLMALLTNQEATVRAAAPVFVAQLGTNARPAVPALLKALNDEDLKVRRNITNALREIAPEALTNAPHK